MSVNLVLASTSPYRAQLLTRLGLPFETAAPEVDECPLPGETPEHLVTRLAQAKAQAVAGGYPDSLVVGSDQVAVVDDHILGKPGNRDNAIHQLQQASGKSVRFLTGLSLYNSRTGRAQVVCEPYQVHFRKLSTEQMIRYVDRERPFNCAGSFKSEGLGIVLFERFEGDDPNALIGLPLIRLVDMLTNEGVELP